MIWVFAIINSIPIGPFLECIYMLKKLYNIYRSLLIRLLYRVILEYRITILLAVSFITTP